MGTIMVRTVVEDMYLVLLLTDRVLHKVRIIKGRKGKRMVSVRGVVKTMVDRADNHWMFRSMEMEANLNKARDRGITVKDLDKTEAINTDKAVEENDSSYK